MKKLAVLMMMACVFVGCGNTATTEAETKHTHAYVEETITPATCETAGEKRLTCDCGDTYTEVISATGHIYENYVSNEDATYLADGTETAKCNGCELTDTRTAEGSKLEYTFKELDKTMYAKQSVNVRDLPNADGNKLGGLSSAQEVHVTGQCEETSWYRIEFEEGIAYVSNSYLADEKPVAQSVSQSVSSSGVPGDTNGDGVLDSQEEYNYIDPIEQALINAGYGNVIWLDATTCAVLTPNGYLNGVADMDILYNYLQANGMYDQGMTGVWIDSSKGYYKTVAYGCAPIPQ